MHVLNGACNFMWVRSAQEGADLARASYFLDSSMVSSPGWSGSLQTQPPWCSEVGVLLKLGVQTEVGFSRAASRTALGPQSTCREY